jgi:hypothetical protein
MLKLLFFFLRKLEGLEPLQEFYFIEEINKFTKSQCLTTEREIKEQ